MGHTVYLKFLRLTFSDAYGKKILGDPNDCFTFRIIDVRKSASVQWPLLENVVSKVFRTNLNFR